MSDTPEGMGYEIEFIAGGVVRDKDGNILDDSSDRAARERLEVLGAVNLLEGQPVNEQQLEGQGED